MKFIMQAKSELWWIYITVVKGKNQYDEKGQCITEEEFKINNKLLLPITIEFVERVVTIFERVLVTSRWNNK